MSTAFKCVVGSRRTSFLLNLPAVTSLSSSPLGPSALHLILGQGQTQECFELKPRVLHLSVCQFTPSLLLPRVKILNHDFCLDVSYSYFSIFISYLTVHGMKTQVCVCRDWSEGKVPGPARDKLQKWAGKREGPQDPKMFNYSIREALLCTIPTPFSSSFSLRTFSLRTSTSSSQGQGLNVADREGHSQVEHHPREVFYNSFHFLFYDKLWEIERVSRRRH